MVASSVSATSAGNPLGIKTVTGQTGVGVGVGEGVGVEVGVGGRGVRVGVGVTVGVVKSLQPANRAAPRPRTMSKAIHSIRRGGVVGFIKRMANGE